MFGYYVYLHLKGDTGEPFYVGKGKGKRIYSGQNRNQWWHHIVSKHGISYDFLGYFKEEQDALAFEVEMISQYRSEGHTLCNLTDGGEGCVGMVHTEAYKEMMRSRKPSDDTRKAISEANRRRVQSPEEKAKRAASLVGRVCSPETRAKIRAARLRRSPIGTD